MINTVSIIGAGRVATHFAQVIAQIAQIQQIYSRTLLKSSQLAKTCQAEAIESLDSLECVDLLLIAVSDAEIATVAQQLAQLNYQGLVVHTSGSTHINVLTKHQLNAGVLYPLQTFSFEHSVDWSNTPLFIEANNQHHQESLLTLAEKISERCYLYDSEQRLSLHLAAVFACNFTNHCYDIAQQILDARQVDFQLLMPLISATADKLQQTSAFQNQTGPARRKDQNILQMHHNMLADQQNWQKIYQLMSESILARFKEQP